MTSKEFFADNLQVKIYPTRESMGQAAAIDAAECLREMLKKKPTINAIFAAAPSQNEFLAALAEQDVDWSRINAFHMDEYIGINSDAPQAFGNFLRRAIFDKVPFRSVHYLNGSIAPEEACENYTQLLKEYPTDVVFMGIGENGHIAFNDPHVADFNDTAWVKVVDLDNKCRMQQVNDGCFASLDEVPTHAMTLTIPALMAASRHFCIVPAATKAEAVKATISGKVCEICPASVLRHKPGAILYLDNDSSKLLE